MLCTTVPVYLTAGNTAAPAPAPVQAAGLGFLGRLLGLGTPPTYQGVPAAAVGSPPTSSPPTSSPPTTSPPPSPPPVSPPPPLRELIVVVPDSLFSSFMDQVRTVGLAVERPRE